MQKFEFIYPMIIGAPEHHGVYLLYLDDTLIYIGRAAGTDVTIKSRLSSHFSGEEGNCTASATHYGWEISNSPILLERELLQTYQNRFGSLPACNDRIG